MLKVGMNKVNEKAVKIQVRIGQYAGGAVGVTSTL